MDVKAILFKSFLILTAAACILPRVSEGATFENAVNEDISVSIITDNYYGNRIGDLIPIKIVVKHKTKGVKVSDKVPRTGSFGDFDIVNVQIAIHPDETVFSYVLQTFLSPKHFPTPVIGAIDLHYTANRYWSEEDQRFLYRKLQTHALPIFQNRLDPENQIPLIYEFDYFSHRTNLAYVLVAFGIVLLLMPLYPVTRSLARRFHDRSYYRNRAFLKKIIEEDLSLYNVVNVSRKLNRMRKDDLLVKVLYQQYRPREEEIKRVALETLSCLEEKRCKPPQNSG